MITIFQVQLVQSHWFKSSDLDQNVTVFRLWKMQPEDCNDTSPICRGELNYSTKITSISLSGNPA